MIRLIKVNENKLHDTNDEVDIYSSIRFEKVSTEYLKNYFHDILSYRCYFLPNYTFKVWYIFSQLMFLYVNE